MPQPEVFKPFKHQQKSTPLRVGQSAELRQVFPPTPTRFGCIHDHRKKKTGIGRQPKSVRLSIFFGVPDSPFFSSSAFASDIKPCMSPRERPARITQYTHSVRKKSLSLKEFQPILPESLIRISHPDTPRIPLLGKMIKFQ
jgi:hypothetical protein